MKKTDELDWKQSTAWKSVTRFIFKKFAGQSKVPIQAIKDVVQANFPNKCKDYFKCKHRPGEIPEWWHGIYRSMEILRKLNLVVGKGNKPGGYTFQPLSKNGFKKLEI